MDNILQKIKTAISGFRSGELLFQNEFGGFDPVSKEYVVCHGGEKKTPRPWSNVISNKNFGTIVTESGLGYTWFDNSKDKRITSWSNDVICDPSSEAVFIKDIDSKETWTITRLPVGTNEIEKEDSYTARHANGYTTFQSKSNGFDQKMRVFVDIDSQIKFISVDLKNITGKKRRISLYYYLDVVMGNYQNQFDPFICSNFNPDINSVLIFRDDKAGDRKKVFVSSSEQISSWTGNKNSFVGYGRSLMNPRGLYQEFLNSDDKFSPSPCCVIKVDIEIEANSTGQVDFYLGAAEESQIPSILKRFGSREAVESSLQKVKGFWKEINSRANISTPDKSLDFFFNNWLLYQVLSCRMWSRTSFYQSGGAFGFRDQLQDSLAFMYVDPQITREHILLCTARQFEEGDVQHWWFPDSGLGVRNKVADSPLWLAYAVAHYVGKIGDETILDQVVSYLRGRALTDEIKAYVDIPETSEMQGTVWEHCIRAIDRVSEFGEHGLPLMKEGDWNDGMNLVGASGKGESVWLGWFLGDALKSFIELAEKRNERDILERFKGRFNKLKDSLHEYAWDGEWYLRAYYDDGTTLGSASNTDCKIDSISQSWSVLSDIDSKERQYKAIESGVKYLIDENHKLLKLLNPPFDKDTRSPGYIKDYVPGVRENSGQYNHAVFWFIMALGKLHLGERALEILNFTNPLKKTGTSEGLYRYELEPYVVGGDIYSSSQHPGKGGWSWYSASAALMYRSILVCILGLHLRGDKILFAPSVPGEWGGKGYLITYHHKETCYSIEFKVARMHQNTVKKLEFDNVILDTNEIPLLNDQKKHIVRVYVS